MNRLPTKFKLLFVAALAVSSSWALADTANEIKSLIESSNDYAMKNLKGLGNETSSQGSLEFWSSGGLLQDMKAGGPAVVYESFSLQPKHIRVITLEEGKSAVAMYYAEGSYHPKGNAKVDHYLTRTTEVYVKEDGKWKVRAAHYSPVTGGSGTSQSSAN